MKKLIVFLLILISFSTGYLIGHKDKVIKKYPTIYLIMRDSSMIKTDLKGFREFLNKKLKEK